MVVGKVVSVLCIVPAFSGRADQHYEKRRYNDDKKNTEPSCGIRRFPDEIADVAARLEGSRGGVPAEDVEENKERKNDQEVEGGDVFDDQFKKRWNSDLRSLVGFGPSLFNAHAPSKEDDQNGGQA